MRYRSLEIRESRSFTSIQNITEKIRYATSANLDPEVEALFTNNRKIAERTLTMIDM